MCAKNQNSSIGKGEIRITVLEDGTVKTETGDLSGPQHQTAEGFMQSLETLLGGKVEQEKIGHSHHHHVQTEREKVNQ